MSRTQRGIKEKERYERIEPTDEERYEVSKRSRKNLKEK